MTYSKGCWEAEIQSPLCISGCRSVCHPTLLTPWSFTVWQESLLWACIWWAKCVACTNGPFVFAVNIGAAGHKVPQSLSSGKGKGNQGKQTKPWLLVYFLSGGTHSANEKLCGMTQSGGLIPSASCGQYFWDWCFHSIQIAVQTWCILTSALRVKWGKEES